MTLPIVYGMKGLVKLVPFVYRPVGGGKKGRSLRMAAALCNVRDPGIIRDCRGAPISGAFIPTEFPLTIFVKCHIMPVCCIKKVFVEHRVN